MKRTDQERIERELRRREKQKKVAARREDKGEIDATPSGFIASLHALLQHDGNQIFNASDDDDVMELLLSMKEELEEKHWEGVLKGAIRKTKIAEKDIAFTELKAVLAEC